MYRYCLRISIAPDEFTEQRIGELIRVCKKYNYDEVIFFVNAENLNVGHMTKEQAQPYLDVIKAAKARLNAKGIGVSLNIWNTLLGIDRGRKLQRGQNFRTMRDMNGRDSTATACPLCEEFRAHFADFFVNAVRQIRPLTVWIEDDFRLHNHMPLEFGGCFCEQHMKEYCKILGKTVTRDEFYKEVVSKDFNFEYRQAWMRVARDTMTSLAAFIGKRLSECGVPMRVGLMSSMPQIHCIENRDWKGILEALSGGKELLDRIHLPCYTQITGQEYCWSFQQVSMLTRAFLPERTCVLPELENAMFSRQTKSANFTRFMVESSMVLGVEGCTLDMDCFCGGGAVDAFGCGSLLKKIKPYMSAVAELNLHPKYLSGVIVPVDEQSSATIHTEEGKSIWELLPYDYWWASQLACMGISYKYSTAHSFAGQIVAIGGQWLRNLTELEIRDLFQKNTVLLNANAVETLFSLGLEDCICAEKALRMKADDITYSYERVENGKKYLGIPAAMASCYADSPDALFLQYRAGKRVTHWTAFYDPYRKRVGNGIVTIEDRVLIFPFYGYHRRVGTLHTLRDEVLKDALANCTGNVKMPLYVNEPCVCVYDYEMPQGKIVVLINFSDDDVKSPVSLYGYLPDSVRGIKKADRNTGKWKAVRFKKCGSYIKIYMKLAREETAVFLFDEGEKYES